MIHLISRLLLAITCLTVTLSEIGQATDRIYAPTDVQRTEDVIYGRKFGMALTMDVFQPAKPNGCAVLFLVNGGCKLKLNSGAEQDGVTKIDLSWGIFVFHGAIKHQTGFHKDAAVFAKEVFDTQDEA